MTDHQIKDAAFRICLKYKDGDKGPTYTFNEKTILEFARALEYLVKKDHELQ